MNASDTAHSPLSWRERPTLLESEAATLIGVSVQTVRRMVEKGQLERRLACSKKLITTRSLIAWEEGSDVQIEPKKAAPISIRPEVQRLAASWSRDLR